MLGLEGLIEMLDYFFILPNLHIFGRQSYRTQFGGCLTLIIGTATFAYLISQTLELTSKSAPTIIQSDQQVGETAEYPLLMNNFTLAVSVTDANNNPLKTINQYFTLTIQKCSRKRFINETTNKVDVSLTCTTLPTEACNSDHFITEIQQEYFSKIRLGQVQCIKKEVLISNPPVLQGIVSGTDYQYIQIQFKACKNTTTSQNCATSEQIYEQLMTGYYVVHLSDSLVQMGNANQISQQIIKLQYTTFSISTSKTIYQGFRIFNANTDDGLIFEQWNNQQTLVQQTYQETSTLYNDDYLVLHYIILDNKLSAYTRSYIKIQTLLSRIGGLWQILFLLVGIVIRPFVLSKMKISIYNQLFRFENNNIQISEKGLDQTQKGQSEININKISRLQKINRSNNKLSSNFFNIFLFTFSCSRLLKYQINNAEKLYIERTDIVQISKKLQELDKLKYVLLTKNQRILFDLIPQPLIKHKLNSQIDFKKSQHLHSIINLYEQLDDVNKLEQGFKSYKEMNKQGKNLNEIDKKIIHYLDKEIIQAFDEIVENDPFEDIKIKKSVNFDQSHRNQLFSMNQDVLSIPPESPAGEIFIKQINRNK